MLLDKLQTKRVGRFGRALKYNQKPFIVWFTGLPGSGKTTLSIALEECLLERDCSTYVLDGDKLRLGLNQDLTFSEADRRENIRRVGEVALLFADASFQVIAAFISPFREDRDRIRASCDPIPFIEVHVEAPIEVCEKRDPKGLYSRARKGLIHNFTGISSPYEPPLNPELVIRTDIYKVEECVKLIIEYLVKYGFLDTPVVVKESLQGNY